jgi:hypothetical protein
LTGYVPWPPLALSFIYGVGLLIAPVLLMALFGRVLPEWLWSVLFALWCMMAALGIPFLWLVGWIVATKWERTSAWAMLKLWWVWLAVVGGLTPASAPPPLEALVWLGAGVGPLVVLFLVRAHYRRKWRGEVRPLDGTI